MRHPSVLVVGAGLIGSAIAHELARAGARVTVLEKSVPGAEASTVAAGILAPRIEHEAGPLLDFGIASLAVHARWADELSRAGLPTGFRQCGALEVARDASELLALEERARRSGRVIDGAEAVRLEPALCPDVLGARLLSQEAETEPPRLLRALLLAAERAGATFRAGVDVQGIVRRGERVVGVEVANETVSADWVVLAAGSWTGHVRGLSPSLATAVQPVRGQLVHLDARRPLVSRVLFGAGGYVVPRADGRLVIGATMEEVGFSRSVTAGGAHTVLSRALTLVPALAEAELVAHAVSFRPATRDTLPLIGEVEPGLMLATGHFRNGILLAPATAELVADHVLACAPRHRGEAFDPRRLERNDR